jgi:hypothetical protein
MLNEGVDLMGMGGMVSAVHSDSDIDRTAAAFASTIATMKAEGVISNL